ncbi:winged helix-turn-helix domain-containing protein [Rhodovulum sp. DZ06]|uniref:winged helix-turn-helix domain-containing protein n=1 Tax=Rhodovulum sp. DZ06 TaxID=3425126 RepID=UPI003D33337A
MTAILSNPRARRLFLSRHLLLRPEGGPARGADLSALLDGLGFVQVDSVNTLARAHDLILWSRRGRYRPEALQRHVARDRAAFEHWTHDASVIPMDAYPLWRLKFARDEARMRARWSAWRREGWHAELDAVLAHVEAHGGTSSSDLGKDEKKNSQGWWDWHPSKTALEFLWRSGRLAVARREGFRKVYDLSERVIPDEHRTAVMAEDEALDRALSAALARLGFATHGELAAFFDIATPAEAKAWAAAALASGRAVPVEVEMADGALRPCLAAPGALDEAASLPEPSNRVRILSPFDPALRDRARAERLFGFHYRIEIFVPEAKRRYGYYVFPVFQGDRAVGRIDAKRDGETLAVRAFWPEPGVRMGAGRIKALEAELERLRRFTGLSEVAFAEDWLRAAA